MKKLLIIIVLCLPVTCGSAVNEWVLGEPTYPQDNYEWVLGGPFVEVDNTAAPPGGEDGQVITVTIF